MTLIRFSLAWIMPVLLACALAGCTKDVPPGPISMDQVPTALKQGFARASTERKELVDRAISSLQDKELGKAMMVVQGLCAIPDLTEKQRDVATRVMLTLNQELKAAADRGDKEAAELLRARQLVK